MNDNIREHLETLLKARIFFGHQSIGQNILDGISSLLQQHRLSANAIIIEDKARLPDGGYIWHQAIGKNRQPASKCEHFTQLVKQQLPGNVDYALFKFCYIDIDEHTDIDALFKLYTQTLDSLISTHSELHFLHCTVPLRHIESGPGVWLRETLGRPNRSKLANIRRNDFNAMLKDYYGTRNVFDLATSESGEKPCTFSYQGVSGYQGLAGAFTDDGGHLNQRGRERVAGDFVSFMAGLIEEDS